MSKCKIINNQKLINVISDHCIIMRKSLNIPSNLTFGIEIEYSNALFSIVNEKIKLEKTNSHLSKDWDFQNDHSVAKTYYDQTYGGEFNSPIFTDNLNTWQEIELMCRILKENDACIMDTCGGHIHIGTQILKQNKKYWSNLLKLWALYEDIIYKFSYGDKKYIRAGVNEYAPPIKDFILERIKKIDNIVKSKYKTINDLTNVVNIRTKEKSLNFNNINNDNIKKSHLEVRTPNGTLNPIIWQNNINFFIKFFMYATSDSFDEELIKYELNNINSKLQFDKAQELSNLIFDNELDKLNFLKQYINSEPKKLVR